MKLRALYSIQNSKELQHLHFIFELYDGEKIIYVQYFSYQQIYLVVSGQTLAAYCNSENYFITRVDPHRLLTHADSYLRQLVRGLLFEQYLPIDINV